MGRFTGFDSGGAELDLSPVFEGQADSVTRKFIVKDRKVRITDELKGVEPGSTVRWTMATPAEVTAGTRRATLAQDDFNQPNPGTRLVLVEARAPESGKLRIEVELAPGG